MGKMKHWLVGALLALAALAATGADWEIVCSETDYPYHLQGIACDAENIYWSFTDRLLVTGWDGVKRKQVEAVSHHGDICLVEGKLYASVLLYDKEALRAAGGKTGWIYVYDAATLALEKKIPLPDTPRPDGITFRDGRFFVADDPHGKDLHPSTPFTEYDLDFKKLKETAVTPGEEIAYGIQTMTAVPEGFFLGLYAKAAGTVLIDKAGKVLRSYPGIRTSVGMAAVPEKIAGKSRLYLTAANRYQGEPRVYGAVITVYEYLPDGTLRKVEKP